MLFVSRTKLRIGTRVSRQFSLFGSRVLHQICSGSVLSVKIRELRYLIHLLYHISIASCKAFLESPELAVSRFKFVLETISHNTFNEGSSEVFLFLRADNLPKPEAANDLKTIAPVNSSCNQRFVD